MENKIFQTIIATFAFIITAMLLLLEANSFHPNVVGVSLLSVVSFGIAIWLFVLVVDATDKTTEHIKQKTGNSNTYITNNFIITDKQTGDKLLNMMKQEQEQAKEISYIA